MTPEELQELPVKLEKLYYNLQNKIIRDVARRINEAGKITNEADWQIKRLANTGVDHERLRKELSELTEKSEEEVEALFHKGARKDYERSAKLYIAINGEAVPYEESEVGEKWANAIIQQTKGEIDNISNSLGFSVIRQGKRQFIPIDAVFEDYVDKACMSIVSGAFTPDEVLRDTIRAMSRSGLCHVGYDSGHINRASVAVRRSVVTGMNQLTAKMNERTANDLGAEYYEVTAHVGARPSHVEWQGQVYKIKGFDAKHRNFVEATGYGTGDGLCGWNCRHSFYPYFEGISERAISEKELQELNEASLREREYKGKTYNAYEATQKQRHMEATMRAMRSNIAGLQAGGAVKADIDAVKANLSTTLAEYKKFSREMDIPTQMERVWIDGLPHRMLSK